ncbi:hypothetical protein CATRI_00185 [Corynebacterium atrinae]|uniref:hypothetical protein n=1 Tax=Corynebacterium atrinae TaxID=1336740 RepID=UPI0025B5181F|nr:hypothetical protein [Corynebacterium atrinae]WJY62160.1 hypothetical protein CATRI_00185 [Corynebacterium atrinae]
MVVSSFGFAGGAVLQHTSIRGKQKPGAPTAMTVRQLLGQLREPKWLLGLSLVGIGTALHISALFLAPVTMVQPIGILAVPWSVLLAAKIGGYRPSRLGWVAVAVTMVGVVGLTALSARFSHDKISAIEFSRVVVAVALCALISLVLLGINLWVSPTFRSLVLASGGAVLFGMTSALLKTLFVWIKVGEPVLSTQAALIIAGVAGTALAGGWMVQQAYAVGHPEVVVGSLTTIDPLVAVLYGQIVLHEGLHIGAVPMAAMALCGVVAILGVAGLAQHHPEVHRRKLVTSDTGRE